MPFTTLTCNVLADSYIRREWYPHTPDEWLDPARRHPALAAHLAAMAADILCLQEVEAPMFATLREHLAHDGYTGEPGEQRTGQARRLRHLLARRRVRGGAPAAP